MKANNNQVSLLTPPATNVCPSKNQSQAVHATVHR